MHYVSIDTHVLGMVLRAATGRSIVNEGTRLEFEIPTREAA